VRATSGASEAADAGEADADREREPLRELHGVLVSRDEYLQMKLAASERARAELGEALGSVRRAVREAGLDVGVINEAIVAARQL